MSATLVVEPVDGGWNVVNADDFNDSMRNLIDCSFIAAPDEGSDVTDEEILDDFVESIGASGWMTTQEVAADMKNAYVNERFPYYGDDYYLGQWDESDEVDYDGNDAVYFMWGESGNRDNSFEVDITCDPDMTDETGRGYGYTIYSGHMVEDVSGYRPEWDIDDAIAAAEKWCETNRDSLSPVERESSKKDKESNMKHRSARKIAHYFDFWGESVNPDGTYEIFWGEDGDMNNSIDLIAKEDDDADTLYCTVIGPDGSELDNFTEANWGDAKDEFDRQCTIDHKYEGLLYNDQDPFDTPKGVDEFASTNMASKKTADAFTYWLSPDGDYYYGIQGDEGRSVQLNVIYGDEEDGILPYAEIIAPDGSTVGETTFDGYQLSDNEIKNWFEDYCKYNVYMPDLIDMTGIDTASVKTSMDGSVWDEEPFGDGCSFYYGPYGDLDNSFNVIVDVIDNTYEYVIYGGNGDILFDKDGFSSVDEAKDAAVTWCQSFNGTTASVKTSAELKFWDKDDSDPKFITGQYGVPGDYMNSRQWNAIQTDDGKWDVSVIGDDGFPQEVGLYKTISEAGSALLRYCNENYDRSASTASVKTSMDEDSNGYSFWGEEPTEDNGFSVWYGEFQEPQNSLPVDVDYYDASKFSYDPNEPGYFTISLHTSIDSDAEDISSEISDVSHDTLDETWQELKEDLPLIAPDYLIPVKEFDEMKRNGEIVEGSARASKTTSSKSLKKANDFMFWGYETDMDYYGPYMDQNKSLKILIDKLAWNPEGKIRCEIRATINNQALVLDKKYFNTSREAQKWAKSRCPELAEEYLENDQISASVKTSMDGDGFSFWGEMKIDAPGLNNSYQMFYGEPENKDNSLKCQAWQSNDPNDNYESECIIKTPDFNTLDSIVLPSWKECKQWFKDYCQDNAVFIDGMLQASSKPEDI